MIPISLFGHLGAGENRPQGDPFFLDILPRTLLPVDQGHDADHIETLYPLEGRA